MKKLIALAMAIVLSSSLVFASLWPECPYDGCGMVWTGKARFCQGIKCITEKLYECSCCNKYFWVVED